MSANEGLKVLLSKLTALLHLTLSEEVLPEKVSSSVVELISQFATVSHEIKSKQNEYEQRESQYLKCLNEMESMVIHQKKEITNFEKKLKKDTRDVAVDASICCQSCTIKDALIDALRCKEIESQEIIEDLEGQVRKSKMLLQAQQIMISGLRAGDQKAPELEPTKDSTNAWNSLFSDVEVPVANTLIPTASQSNNPLPTAITSPVRPPLPPTVAIPHRYQVNETHSDDDEDYLDDDYAADPDSAAAVQEAFGGDFTGEGGDEDCEGADREEESESSGSYEYEGEEGESTEGDYAEGIGGFDQNDPYYDEMSEELRASADQDEALYTQDQQEKHKKPRDKNETTDYLAQQDDWNDHADIVESGSLEFSVDPSWSYSSSENSESIEKINSSAESAVSMEGRRRHWEGLVEDGSVEDSFSLIQNFYEIK